MTRKDSRAGQQATRRSRRCDKRRENEREGIIILSCSVEVGPGENRGFNQTPDKEQCSEKQAVRKEQVHLVADDCRSIVADNGSPDPFSNANAEREKEREEWRRQEVNEVGVCLATAAAANNRGRRLLLLMIRFLRSRQKALI